MANPRYNKQVTNRRGAMGGGMMRKMYSKGTNGNGKPVSKSKNPGLAKMAKTEKGKAVVKKFGYNPNRMVANKGGRAKFGSGSPKTITGMKPTLGLKKTEEYKKKLKEKNKGKK
jgi:hypothetical protein